MCLAIPGKIVTIDEVNATAETMGIRHMINIQLIENLNIGDYVLIHAGFAIEKIHKAYYTFLEEQYHEYLAFAENHSRDQ